jgi:quinoprotein glucose dehydrogenase
MVTPSRSRLGGLISLPSRARKQAFHLLLSSAILIPAMAQTDWPSYGNGPAGLQYSPLKQINTANVGKLQVAWTYDTRPKTVAVPTAGTGPAAPPRARPSQSTPLVVGGVMYMSTSYSRVVALEAETGKVIWEYESPATPANRGITYWPGDADLPPQILFGTGSGLLISLNAKTGKPVPGFGEEGKVNLRAGVADNFPRGHYGMSTPGAIYKNLIFTGAQLQEEPGKGPSGDVRAWDIRTGKLAWTFHTVPRPGEANHEAWQGDQWIDRSGTNVWGFMTVDVERGMLFVPLGTPTPDFYGGDRKGSNLYGSSLVALDAATGKLKWYFQTTHHDNWDYDLTSPPALIEVTRNGKKIPAVSQWTKQGLLFIFNRLTGEPIYKVEERKVLNDNASPGDENWPTQPFPVSPPPLARMTFEPTQDVATVTPEHEAYCKGLLALDGGAIGGGPYAQYGPKVRVIFPGWTGGGNWNPTAFEPGLGYVYVTSQDLGNLNKMIPSQDGSTYKRVAAEGAPGNSGGRFWDGAKKWPCQKPPWGEIVAVNVNTGNVAWRSPLGSFDELDALGVPKTGTPEHRGGPIATAGGLVFIGATIDARFRAFDARTGKELWTTRLADAAKATPITFEGKNGKQYVAILAAGGEVRGPDNPGGRLYVFALP